jgi:hypothetical protein
MGFSSYERIPQGFTLKMYGRAGYIYFRENENIMAIDVEISGSTQCSLVLYHEGLYCWVFPKLEPIAAQLTNEILPKLRLWLTQSGNSTDLDFPPRPWLPN